MPRRSLWILLVLVLISIIQWVHFYPLLPDRVAHRFDGRGGSMHRSPKAEIAAVTASVEALMLLIFLGIPWISARIPISWWNLPNREYWFDAKQKCGTLASIRQYLIWLGAAILGFMLMVSQNVINVNVPESERISVPGMEILTVLLILCIGVWSGMLLRRFRLPGEARKKRKD